MVNIGQLGIVVQILQVPRKLWNIGHHTDRVVINIQFAFSKFHNDTRTRLIKECVMDRGFHSTKECEWRQPHTDFLVLKCLLDLSHILKIPQGPGTKIHDR